MQKKFTIVIPIFNEVESIFELVEEIFSVFKNYQFELLIVNDGSTDTFINESKKKFLKNNINIVSHSTNKGKCVAMLTGIKKSKNNIICVIDGDGQNPPSEAKKMLEFWMKEDAFDFKILCGHRINRMDNFIKRISSKIANYVRRLILKDDCFDTACALKVFHKKDYLKLGYFKNMHRFLPAMFKYYGGKVINIPIIDRTRKKGASKFNFNNRFWVGIIDLLKVLYFLKFKRSNK